MEELMATLNIKIMPNGLSRKLKALAKRQRRSVAQEVIEILSRAVRESETLSILDLRGLGKEVWIGTEADKLVDEERRSWR